MRDVKTFAINNYRYLALAMVLMAIAVTHFGRSENLPVELPASADTYIPSGYVLVPIDVSNRQALEALLGSFGVVDLYRAHEGGRGQKIATRVKILRAPLKPDEFAVLVREQEASEIVQNEEGYFVVLQNPAQRGTKLVRPTLKRSRLSFEEG